VKGSIMALIGVLISRVNVGVELFVTNLIYAPIAYLFIAFSGLTVIKILQILQTPSNTGKLSLKQALLLFGTFFIIGIVLTVINVVLYVFNIVVIIYVIIIGVLWVIIGLLAYKNVIKSEIIYLSLVCLVFTLGIIYGALLNASSIPMSIFFAFITATFLQAGREMVKSYDKKDRGGGFISIDNEKERDVILKVSLGFQALSSIFLVLILFSNIAYPVLYFFVMLICLIFICSGIILTLKSIKEKKDYMRTSWLLKYGILFEIFAFLVVGS
jgi:4-hydroxybenzoate polyprenyltransferase